MQSKCFLPTFHRFLPTFLRNVEPKVAGRREKQRLRDEVDTPPESENKKSDTSNSEKEKNPDKGNRG